MSITSLEDYKDKDKLTPKNLLDKIDAVVDDIHSFAIVIYRKDKTIMTGWTNTTTAELALMSQALQYASQQEMLDEVD